MESVKDTNNNNNNNINNFKILLDASFQEVKRSFVLAFDNINNGANKVERNSHRKCFLSRENTTNYNVIINGRSFLEQHVGDQTEKYDEIRNTATRQGDYYTTGCLLDYQYLKDYIN